MPKRILKDLGELFAFAESYLAARPQGLCVGLSGEVGSGKTTFVRACIESICRRAVVAVPRVVSPSYVIQQSYRDLKPPVEHFDLYRMQVLDFQALVEMGYFEALSDCRARHGFLFIEWPERAKPGLLELQETLHFAIEGKRHSVNVQGT